MSLFSRKNFEYLAQGIKDKKQKNKTKRKKTPKQQTPTTKAHYLEILHTGSREESLKAPGEGEAGREGTNRRL